MGTPIDRAKCHETRQHGMVCNLGDLTGNGVPEWSAVSLEKGKSYPVVEVKVIFDMDPEKPQPQVHIHTERVNARVSPYPELVVRPDESGASVTDVYFAVTGDRHSWKKFERRDLGACRKPSLVGQNLGPIVFHIKPGNIRLEPIDQHAKGHTVYNAIGAVCADSKPAGRKGTQ